MAKAVREWMETYPAVRVAHRAEYPAGKGLEAWQDNTGATFVKALIVDDNAKRMVRKGVLRAYSVGMADVQKSHHPNARRFFITGGRLAEVSLVDSPSNARCGIQVTKGGQYIGKAYGNIPKLSKAERKTAKDIAKARAHRPTEDELYIYRLSQWLSSDNPIEREAAREALRARGVFV
jgi:hypothetical protein